MLASVDLSADVEAIHASAAVQGRAFNASRDEIQAATTTVDTALQHPLLRRAVASGGQGNIRCEMPVLLVLGDGSIAEGVLDLAFRKKTPSIAGFEYESSDAAR